MMKRKCCVLLVCMMLAVPKYGFVQAAEVLENDSQVNVNMCILFKKNEVEKYIKAIEKAKNYSEEQLKNEILLSSNMKKKELLEEYLDSVENVNVEDMFEKNGNIYELKIPCRDNDIVIGEEEFVTDDDGKIYLESEEIEILDEENVPINLLDYELDDEKVSIEMLDNGDIEIDNYVTIEECAEGVIEMADDMSETEAQAVICNTGYPRVAPGEYIGNGKGRTKVYFDTNIVGCNKHDKSIKSITATEFLKQSSDCAMSFWYGVLALYGSNDATTRYYMKSIHCYNEALSDRQNEYCNGRKKSGHVNCSWFNGIGHTEMFHTHRYTN